MSQKEVEIFASIFAGRADVWGAVHGQAIKETVSLNHYARHLGGRTSLGVYPLTPAGVVRWFAIDIDRPDPALSLQVMATLSRLGVDRSVYLERSKGKGHHVIVLLSDWTPAPLVRRIAKAALGHAGLPATTEVFPKQDELTQQTSWGNYLNLPYCGGEHPEGRRMVLDPETLRPLPLQEWLNQVQLFPAEQISVVAASLQEDDSPVKSLREDRPKLGNLLTTNHSTGTRRPTLVSLAGHLRVRGADEDVAVELLLPWARERFEPTLPDGEVEKHVRGIYRRYGIPAKPHHGHRSGNSLPTVEVGP